jgi:hypothetical protein
MDSGPRVDDEAKPRCDRCGIGKLIVIEERPHPLYGILGVTLQTLQCDQLNCAHRVFT